MVGYPDKFRDYRALEIEAGRPLRQRQARRTASNADYALEDLGKPVDRKKWAMNPQTVNAYNGGLENKIVFPAGHPAAAVLRSARPTRRSTTARSARSSATRSATASTTRAARSTRPARSATGGPPDDAKRFDAEAEGVRRRNMPKFEAVPGVFINPDADDGREHRRLRRRCRSRSTPTSARSAASRRR